MPFIRDDFLLGTPSARRLKLLVGCGASIFFFLLCSGEAQINSRVFLVKAFGAVGDGQHDDTDAIQSTIAQAARAGGVVLLTPGTYVSGPLYLKSNVIFDIEPNVC